VDAGESSTAGEPGGSGPSSSSLAVTGRQPAAQFLFLGQWQRLQQQHAAGQPGNAGALHPDAQSLLGPLLRLHPADRDVLLRTITRPNFVPQKYSLDDS
jgi:hypothetical protein